MLEYSLREVSFEGRQSDAKFGLQKFLITVAMFVSYLCCITGRSHYIGELTGHGFLWALQLIMKFLHYSHHHNPVRGLASLHRTGWLS